MTDENLGNTHRIIYLICEDIANRITAEEKIELEHWLTTNPEHKELYTHLLDSSYRNNILKKWEPETANASLKNVRSKMTPERRIVLLPKILIAASLLIFSAIAIYLAFNRPDKRNTVVKNKIIPGGNKAILTLASGKKIVLTNAGDGILANQTNVRINKAAGGQLSYTEKMKPSSKLAYDTLTTPRGGVYQLILADGSKVWLNASTSIRFPENFSNRKREVEVINGEAYFEVVHNKDLPFRINTPRTIVDDIGTHFNINSYKDETSEKITLTEGAVAVSKGHYHVRLLPDQQAVVRTQLTEIINPITVHQIEAEEAIAWKEGFFVFDNANIQSIMRQIARWYDVEIAFSANLPTDDFGGTVSRYSDVNEVLKRLELTNKVHFKVIGRRILVSK